MAGDWIPVRTDLTRSREVLAIARATGRSRHEVVGLLVALWGWASGETVDGLLARLKCADLCETIGGDAPFWESVAAEGWLAITDAGLTIPNFERWLGNGAKSRLQKAKRQASWRSKQQREALTRDASVDAGASTPASTTGQDRTEQTNTPLSPPRGKRSGKTAESEIPETLDTPAFRDAWMEWIAYRRERKATCSARTLSKQLAMLAELGPAVAIESLQNSIRAGWQGLFKPKAQGNHNGKPRYADGPGQRHPDDKPKF